MTEKNEKQAEPVAWSANWIRDRIADQVEGWPNRDWSNRIIANQIRRIEIAAPAPSALTDFRELVVRDAPEDQIRRAQRLDALSVELDKVGVNLPDDTLHAVIYAIEAAAPFAALTDEAAMRAALRIMANLEDRSGVMDGIDDDTKADIADEIAVTIRTALLAASPADHVSSAARELISQIEKAAPVDDHGHRLCMNAALIKLKELL